MESKSRAMKPKHSNPYGESLTLVWSCAQMHKRKRTPESAGGMKQARAAVEPGQEVAYAKHDSGAGQIGF